MVRSMCAEHSWLVTDLNWRGYLTGLKVAAAYGREETVAALLELGFNVNAVDLRSRICAFQDLNHLIPAKSHRRPQSQALTAKVIH